MTGRRVNNDGGACVGDPCHTQNSCQAMQCTGPLSSVCGDGEICTLDEECDDGVDNSYHGACLPGSCVENVCGDGHVKAIGEDSEECDANLPAQRLCPFQAMRGLRGMPDSDSRAISEGGWLRARGWV